MFEQIISFLSAVFANVFFETWLGAICAHILSLYSSTFKGTIPFVKSIFPDKSATFYSRLDFVILPVIGTLLAYVLLEPDNLKSSIFAGLSWSGTLIALLKRSTTVAKEVEV